MDPLASCVNTLKTSLSLLDSSIATLDSGVRDFPRLAKVLTTTRHFELVPESRLQAAQSHLHAEIAPEVASLLAKVETYLERLERREGALRARAELLEGRLEAGGGETPNEKGYGKKSSGSAARRKVGKEGPRDLKMHMLVQKRERLKFAVERLQLQAGQRERQLRKSVAAS
ncbi:MAG: hypothetical protein M1814_006142 [Vezdaea aestivalis]|nr:MAG: hypothetical protein M1814_006142 [Vezdaea aestivalis]